MIVQWPSGNLTIVGDDAWKLYTSLQDVRFHDPRPAPRVTPPARNMRHLLECAEPCDDVPLQIEQSLRAEAALAGLELDWPQFTIGPVALRLSSEITGLEEPVLTNREGRYAYLPPERAKKS